jgi:hypothetical protein
VPECRVYRDIEDVSVLYVAICFELEDAAIYIYHDEDVISRKAMLQVQGPTFSIRAAFESASYNRVTLVIRACTQGVQ